MILFHNLIVNGTPRMSHLLRTLCCIQTCINQNIILLLSWKVWECWQYQDDKIHTHSIQCIIICIHYHFSETFFKNGCSLCICHTRSTVSQPWSSFCVSVGMMSQSVATLVVWKYFFHPSRQGQTLDYLSTMVAKSGQLTRFGPITMYHPRAHDTPDTTLHHVPIIPLQALFKSHWIHSEITVCITLHHVKIIYCLTLLTLPFPINP